MESAVVEWTVERPLGSPPLCRCLFACAGFAHADATVVAAGLVFDQRRRRSRR